MRDYVTSNAIELPDTGTIRLKCPVCNGKDTFTISKHGGALVHNCYKASCDKSVSSGIVFLDLDVETRRKLFYERKEGKPKQSNMLEFTHPSYWIDGIGDETCRQYMEKTHMMTAYKQGLFRPMYDPAERRFVFPIKNTQGEVIGAVGRTLIGATPKVLNYSRTYTQPFICGRGGSAILVEDCASAVAVARIEATGVALLGTHLREEFIPHLSKYSSVGIALDADAYSKSFKMKKLLDSYLKNVYILRLTKDIKDMSDAEWSGYRSKILV